MKTIMLTGGTGYLGSYVAKELLGKGYHLRLSLRDPSKTHKYKHLSEIAQNSPGTLEPFEADLLKEGSFDQAAKGSDAIIHMASPFTLKFKDPVKELIEPAVKGTRNVLEAAKRSGTVKKVVLTSSVAAVHGDNIDMKEQGLAEFTEEHFNTSSSAKHQPYSYSKVMAEKEAWKIVKEQDQWKLVVINPSFVMGPPLSPHTRSESIQFLKDLISGKLFLGVPQLEFGFVDVRDVAKAHLLALEKEDSKGRYILAERVMRIWELRQMIAKLYPGKFRFKLPLMESPKFMIYLIGWAFGLTYPFIKRNVGYSIKLNNQRSLKELGLTYTPMEKTIKEMVEALV